MNGKKAKKLRKQVYGEDGAPRFRQYSTDPKTGKLVADPQRRIYKKMKKFMR